MRAPHQKLHRRTIEIEGQQLHIATRAKTHLANFIGWNVRVNGELIFSSYLHREEAEKFAVRRFLDRRQFGKVHDANGVPRVKLPSGFYLEDAANHGQYFYYKPNVLCNIVTEESAERLMEPARTFVLDAIRELRAHHAG